MFPALLRRTRLDPRLVVGMFQTRAYISQVESTPYWSLPDFKEPPPTPIEEDEENQDEDEKSNKRREKKKKPVNQMKGISNFSLKLRTSEGKGKHMDQILEPDDLSEYKPFYDPKYQTEKLTTRSSTYMDIIRLAPKPDVRLPADTKVKDARSFNLTLLELFELGNVKQARDYFMKVTKRSDCPADLHSYNIAIAEFVNAGEVALAGLVFNLLKQTPFQPNIITFNAMISASVKYSSFAGVENYLNEMKMNDIEPNKTTKEYLMALHLRTGKIDEALEIMNNLDGDVSLYVYGLFARAYAKIGNFEKVSEYAWRNDVVLSDDHCHHIVMDLVKEDNTERLKMFLEEMQDYKAKLSWTASQAILRICNDPRYKTTLTPIMEKLLAETTKAPTDKERLSTIRHATMREREEEVVFRKRKRRIPIWKRKVSYKNPADSAWDNLIQEYLAVAVKDKRMRENYARIQRANEEIIRDTDPRFGKKKKKVIKTQKRWKL